MSSWTSSEVCRSLLPFKALLKTTYEKVLVQLQQFLNKTEMRTIDKYLSAYLKSKNNIAAAIYQYKCSASQREYTASGVCLTSPRPSATFLYILTEILTQVDLDHAGTFVSARGFTRHSLAFGHFCRTGVACLGRYDTCHSWLKSLCT